MFLDKEIQQLRDIQKSLNKEAEKIAIKYKEQILDYIREKQLFEQGIDGKGLFLADKNPYKPFTIAIKQQKGQPTNRVTLEDTGSFYRGFDLIFTDQNAIGVFSRDEKTPELIEKYGADIFIFTNENIEEINSNIFEENLIKWILTQPPFTTI
jgi:hypothetical protein